MNLSGEIIIDVDIVNGLKKEFQKMKITHIIAIEHNHRHDSHNKKLKNQESKLIEIINSHCSAFNKEFDGVAKGDWTKSAMEELSKINTNLKSIAE
ncbi:hypothetical protein MUA52_00425 [Staphylococcus agnetis]|uniref:hypothetical protein n=1 Tax=Staphylococcus agnetis TaxID=985762 RepID=UPI0021D3D7B5|nr:hypothetical protein [Staphylococcus agnetis]UXU64298.1 hypothetical protein MUA84_00425 [Staphylococcus agnetis]UXU66638.1 hypothetical protein MUA52_00425 [Staphylococcus agnetis]